LSIILWLKDVTGVAGRRHRLLATEGRAEYVRQRLSLLNNEDTPMDFVVGVLERFLGMSNDEAITHMLRIHNEES